MKCPRCGHLESKVADTRTNCDFSLIRRRRHCLECGYRFFTNEIICAEYPSVIKRDGRKEEFSREKIKGGLIRAFKKEDGLEEKVERLLDGVIGEIISQHPAQVESQKIGSIVMAALKAVDQAAYLRFASIYKGFESVDDFASECCELLPGKEN